jgi:ankyrin repeat protein
MTVMRSGVEIVKVLLNNKPDHNICGEGDSPLYNASHEGHTEIVELLLNNKADPNIWYVGSSPNSSTISV